MARATSVRLEESTYARVKHIARRRGVSMNSLIGTVLLQEIALDEEQEMYDAATVLGQAEESAVDFALAAQAEIVLSD